MRFILLFLLCSFKVLSQTDTIYFYDGAVVPALIKEVNTTQVRYVKPDNELGPSYLALLTDIRQIVYRNGQVQTFATKLETEPISKNPPVESAPAPAKKAKKQVVLPFENSYKFMSPMVGATGIGPGYYADKLILRGKQLYMSQLSFQLETRLFSNSNGFTGLVLFVPALAGLEQGLFLASGSVMTGFRVKDQFEFALGPSLAYNGLGLIISATKYVKLSDLYMPINVFFVPNVTTVRQEILYNGTTITTVETSGYRAGISIGFTISH